MSGTRLLDFCTIADGVVAKWISCSKAFVKCVSLTHPLVLTGFGVSLSRQTKKRRHPKYQDIRLVRFLIFKYKGIERVAELGAKKYGLSKSDIHIASLAFEKCRVLSWLSYACHNSGPCRSPCR